MKAKYKKAIKKYIHEFESLAAFIDEIADEIDDESEEDIDPVADILYSVAADLENAKTGLIESLE